MKNIKLKKVLLFPVAIFFIIILVLGMAHDIPAAVAQQATDKIESSLIDQITSQGSADFIVRFADQADLEAAYSMDWDARGEFVYRSLKETADLSQVNARAMLDANGFAHETFIAGNELYVWAGNQPAADGLAILNELAALPEVSYIRATRTYTIEPIVEAKPFEQIYWAGDFLANNALTTVIDPNSASIDWGLNDTKATQFWSTFSKQGEGIVVANIDTGVQWNHPALVQAFKCGANSSDPACWLDPSNICPSGACDNNGHGTHTMGTMVGDDDPNLLYTVGMAPNAKWIACKGCETNSCSDYALNACADWIVAPNGNPVNRPNVVNNSWGGDGGSTWYQVKVQAWRAAGIFPAFSAGNGGPGCSTLSSPGDYQISFASAAHDSLRNIAGFSSRGPSTAFGHDPYTKPNLSSPGVSICSSVPGDTWSCGYSGTSMASPHTAGAVALLWSCNPSLVGQIDATFQLLQNNADTAPSGTCSAPPDNQGNYTYGYGYLNVFTAGLSTCSGAAVGTLEGHVYDQGNNPVAGATVSTSVSSKITDAAGHYTMNLPVGTYEVKASKNNYTTQTVTGVVIGEGSTTTQDFNLTFLGEWHAGPSMCFDLTRLDGEFYAKTGLVYFLGGRSSTLTDGNIYSFNPVTGICADTNADMPMPISNYTVNLVNNGIDDVLCTFGGRAEDGSTTSKVQCYNPNTNTASLVTDLPAEWAGYTPGAQVVVDNKVYIFGGFNSFTGVTALTYRYDPQAKTFTKLDDLNMARTYILATAVDGVIYAFGGDTWNGIALDPQKIAEKFDPAVGTWDDAGVADLPLAGDEGQAFGFSSRWSGELAGQIVLATLSEWPTGSNAVVVYDIAGNTYKTEFPGLVNARRNHAGVFIPIITANPDDGLPGMWVFGGWFGGDNPPYAPAEYYHPKVVVTTIYLPLLQR